jgi:aprataxin
MMNKMKLTGKRKFTPRIEANDDATNLQHEGKEDLPPKPLILVSSASTERTQSDEEEQRKAEMKPFESFRFILYQYIRQPEKYTDCIIFRNESCTLIKDAYPKAKIHLLLLPNEAFMTAKDVRYLSKEEPRKVEYFHSIAKAVVASIQTGTVDSMLEGGNFEELIQQYAGDLFQLGYHIIPSLYPLHLHIMTQDFDSPSMNKKVHWNKFTTDFFVTTELVERMLQTPQQINRQGLLDFPSEEFYSVRLKSPLTCICCGESLNTITKMKQHYVSCDQREYYSQHKEI